MAVFGIPRLHEDDAAARGAGRRRDARALAALNEELRARSRRRAPHPDRGEHGRGRGRRPGRGPAARDRRRRQRRGAARAGGTRRARSCSASTTYRLVRDAVERRARRAARRSRARPSPSPRSGSLEVRPDAAGPRTPPRRADGRPRARSWRCSRRRSTGGRRPHCAPVHAARLRRGREVPPGPRVPDRAASDGARSCAAAACPTARASRSAPLAEVVQRARPASARATRRRPPRAKVAALLGDADEATRIAGASSAGLVGLGRAAAAPEDAFWAVRKLLEHLARTRRSCVVFDDIHWARADVPRPDRAPRGLDARRRRSCCSASRGPSCSRSARVGRRQDRTRRRSCSSRSPPTRPRR